MAPRVERGDLAAAADLLERVVELGDPIERGDLGLVGEQDVDVVLDEVEELVAVPLDAERVGQRERHTVSRVVRGARRLAERVLRLRLVPQVALEEEHLRACQQLVVELGGSELRRRRPDTC